MQVCWKKLAGKENSVKVETKIKTQDPVLLVDFKENSYFAFTTPSRLCRFMWHSAVRHCHFRTKRIV
jgi:hypothetical protein